MQHRPGFAIALALGAAALYGTIPNLSRAAFEHGVPAVDVAFARTSLIAVVMAIVAILRNESFALARAGWRPFLMQAAATAAISICYLASVQFVPVSLAVLVFFTFPVLILLAAPLIEGRRPGRVRIAIALAAFAGLAIAIGPSFDRLDWRGVALAALSSCMAAMQFFSGRGLSRHLGPAALAALVHIAVWPATLLAALLYGGGILSFLPGGAANAPGHGLLLAVAAIYCFAYGIHLLSLRNAPASTVAPYYNLEPVVTTAIAALFLGERLDLPRYAGGGIVLAALAVSSAVEKFELARARPAAMIAPS